MVFSPASSILHIFLLKPQWPAVPRNKQRRPPSPYFHAGPGPPSSLTNSLDPGSADVGRGGESGGRGGESSAETVETEEAPAAAELRSGVSRPSASQSCAHSWPNTNSFFWRGRQGPCGRQAGSPSGHRDPRAQWRGRQQNRQHRRDRPQRQRSKCQCPGGSADLSPPSSHPRPRVPTASPASPSLPPTPRRSRSGASEMRCPQSSCRVSGSAGGRGRATRWAAACRWPRPRAPSASRPCSPRWGRWVAASSCSSACAAYPCSSWRWAWPQTPSSRWRPRCTATTAPCPPTLRAGSSPPTPAASASPERP